MEGTTGGSEIEQVQGDRILRSTTGRHSKIYTSKGLRDRRVRLSAHTAIQFYDVQDRLGYDRPSKAVDWLIDKAKTAIEKLNEQQPTDTYNNLGTSTEISNPSSSELLPLDQKPETFSAYSLIPDNDNSSSEENDMKPFFPTSSLSFPDFGNYSVSRASFQGENLGLSLQSFQGDNCFQESFQITDNWNRNGDTDSSRSVGFLLNTQPFSYRELLHSNLSFQAWNINRPLASMDGNSSEFRSCFDVEFDFPSRVYGEQEPEIRHR